MTKILVLLVLASLAALSQQASLARERSYTTYPSVVDDSGAHVSYDLRSSRRLEKRDSARNGGSTLIKLEAFGEALVLDTSVSAGAGFEGTVVERWTGGNSSQHQQIGSTLPPECFLTGAVRGREDSWVAVSRCGGLRGVIASDGGYLFVEPAEGSSSGVGPQKHVVTRRDVPSPLPVFASGCKVYGEVQDQSKEEDGGRKRRSVVEECIVEVAVVADASMVQAYGHEDLEAYLFTLMHIVAHLYREPSIGTAVTVAVVRVVLLDPAQPQFVVSSNAHMSLSRFCNWQRVLGASPHHDTAVLLTREAICEVTDSNCGSLGMAEFEGTCDPDKSCSISRDSGLSTAFTIAHEMAHGLGVRHDGDPSVACSSLDDHYIMAPSFAQSDNPHLWSDCSSSQLIAFLRSPSAHCLWNRPAVQETFSGVPLLPGMERSADQQCQLLHGSQARQCAGMQDECSRLWCQVDAGGDCVHQYSPPAAGTQCTLTWGESGVCYQGLCVEYSTLIDVVDGGWGEWGAWSNCSFPCGTGVQYSERFCHSPVPANGGSYCLGQNKRYQTCNTSPCSSGVSYRQELCQSSYNLYRDWTAVSIEHIDHLGIDPCKLHCVPHGQSTIYTTISLPDGVSCLVDGSQGVCVSGQCQAIDCASQLGAASYQDYCGVWCGNGSSCVNASGSYVLGTTDVPNEYLYYDTAVVIPAGSSNVLIQETTVSQSNYIALESAGVTLNGDYRLLPQYSSLWFADSSWLYERPSRTAETFYTKGPLGDNVTIYVLANHPYDGIKYSFALQTSQLGTPLQQPLYYWTSSEWGSCDAACGPGREARNSTCRLLGSDTPVDDDHCDQPTRPVVTRHCQLEECQFQWTASNWSSCEAPCGQGVQTREVECQQTNSLAHIVADSSCNITAKPDKCQLCDTGIECRYEWLASDWGQCDALCGPGQRARNVRCILLNAWEDGTGPVSAASEDRCNLTSRPAELEDCAVDSCLWNTSEWTECNAACDSTGVQTRDVACQLRNGTDIAPGHCQWVPRPTEQQPCTGEPCPSCQDSLSESFCTLVTRYTLCHIHRHRCCASCS